MTATEGRLDHSCQWCHTFGVLIAKADHRVHSKGFCGATRDV